MKLCSFLRVLNYWGAVTWVILVPFLIYFQVKNADFFKSLTRSDQDRKAYFIGRAIPILTKDYFLMTSFLKQQSVKGETYQLVASNTMTSWDQLMLIHYSEFELRPMNRISSSEVQSDWILVYDNIDYAKNIWKIDGGFRYAQIEVPGLFSKKWSLFRKT